MHLRDGAVVLPNVKSETLDFAFEELSKIYFESTGKKLSLASKVNNENIVFSLGKTELLKKANFDKDYSVLREDGFFILEKDDVVYIDGNTDYAILYGVYDFLEVYLGARFFSADTTVIPKTDKIEKIIDRFEIPAIDYRAYMSGDCFHSHGVPEFMARSRTHNPFTHIGEKYGGRDFLIGRHFSTHNMNYYVPYNEWHDSHPEFFYQREGVKEVQGYNEDGTGCSPNLTVCLSNGITDDGKLDESMDVSVAKVVIEEFKKDILENPQAKYFTFEQEDLSYGCECPKCMEEAKKYKRSGMMVRFCNVIAEELQKWADAELGGREINIVTFAYNYTKEAPVIVKDGKKVPIDSTVIPRNNVVMRLAIFANDFYPLFDEIQPPEVYDPLHDWWDLGTKFMFWGYDIGFDCICWYWPTYKNLQANVKGLASKEMIYVQIESEHKNNWQNAFRGYIYNKLLWNPDLDVQTMGNEFLDAYFGKTGAKYVKEFMQVYEDFYEKAVPERGIFFTMLRNYREAKNLDIEVIDKTLEIINKAIAETEAEDIPEETKARWLKHLTCVRCTPLFCKYKGFEYYYPNATKEEKRILAKQFIADGRAAGLNSYHSSSDLFNFEELERNDYDLPY